MHLLISIGLLWTLKVEGLTSEDTVRGTNILILVKSVSIVYVPYSIDLFFAASNVKVLWSFIR